MLKSGDKTPGFQASTQPDSCLSFKYGKDKIEMVSDSPNPFKDIFLWKLRSC
jgi:hypothetical protein